MSGLSVFDVIIPGYAFRHLFPNDDGERTERRAQEQEAQRAREHAAVLQQVREDNERRAAQAEERMQRAEESRLKEMREMIESESRMQRESCLSSNCPYQKPDRKRREKPSSSRPKKT